MVTAEFRRSSATTEALVSKRRRVEHRVLRLEASCVRRTPYNFVCIVRHFPSSSPTPSNNKMIRQNLAKQLRQASYAFPTPLSSARPQFQALSTRLPAPARAKILSRWYSSAEPAEGAKSGETSQKEPAPVKEEDPRDKELQAKNKEVIELKVSRTSPRNAALDDVIRVATCKEAARP